MGSEHDVRPGDKLLAAKLAVFNLWGSGANITHERRWELINALIAAAKADISQS